MSKVYGWMAKKIEWMVARKYHILGLVTLIALIIIVRVLKWVFLGV